MINNRQPWVHIFFAAVLFSALFAAVGYGYILAGGKFRSGKPIGPDFVLFLAVAGAVVGGVNTWRSGRVAGPPRPAESRFFEELVEARRGLPDQAKAMRTVATTAVIPAAVVGILAGTLLVGEGTSFGQLLLVCSATAFGAGFGTLALVWGVYRVFGFAPVVVLADVLLGGLAGFFSGALLGKLLDSWWPWLLVPLGVVFALVLPRVLRTKEDSACP
ncbi:MAG: hypothetical protein ACRCZF_25840, partial [Gemmataceae bacterium]